MKTFLALVGALAVTGIGTIGLRSLAETVTFRGRTIGSWITGSSSRTAAPRDPDGPPTDH